VGGITFNNYGLLTEQQLGNIGQAVRAFHNGERKQET
jgi:hypothetical protein